MKHSPRIGAHNVLPILHTILYYRTIGKPHACSLGAHAQRGLSRVRVRAITRLQRARRHKCLNPAHSKMAVSVLMGLSSYLLSVCSGQCPISGCDSLRSFSSPGDTRLETLSPHSKGSTEPKLLWSYEQSRPSGAGCATDGAGDSGVVICPIDDGQK